MGRSPHIVKLDLRLVRTMASSLRPASRLVARPLSGSSILRQVDRSPFFCATAQFHTSSPRNALPAGPPPSGYRLPRPKRFYEGENAINKASNYFLLAKRGVLPASFVKLSARLWPSQSRLKNEKMG